MSLKSSIPNLLRKLPPLALKPVRFATHALQKPLIEFGLHQFFRDSINENELEVLEGRQVLLDISDINLQLLVEVIAGKPRLVKSVRVPDLSIRGNLEEFVLLASNREDPDTQFFQRRITIEGDTELGLEVKNLIYSLDPERLPAIINRFLSHLGWLVEKSKSAASSH